MSKIIEKVKKLLALSESNEPHEAALAMEKARALMTEHGISVSDLKVADVKAAMSEGGQYKTPPDYISKLATLCGDLFECGMYWSTSTDYVDTRYGGFRKVYMLSLIHI